jgi:uncharacterized protein YndB with AHSA1/START domain
MITRVFDAPRSLVWKAMTTPEHLKRWPVGPPGWSMTLCSNELLVGGTFRCVWRGPLGQEMVMRGVHREVVSLERIVRMEFCDFDADAKAGGQLATLTFAEHGGDGGPGGQTVLAITLLYSSKEARDAAIASGVDRGTALAYDSLETWLAVAASAGAQSCAA